MVTEVKELDGMLKDTTMQTTKQEFKQFFKQYFEDFEVRIPMFYLWDIGLRFDLQKVFTNPVSPDNDAYFKECLFRAIQIFETAFEPTDEIYLIIYSFKRKKHKIRRGNFIFKQIKDLDFANIFFRRINQLYEPGDRTDRWNRAIILTEINKIDYEQILEGQINTDFWKRSPRICEEVFFVNINKRIVFNIYDDRGLDIIATDIEAIRPIYEKHKDWILSRNREKIELQFK